ncbi:MAG: hypothetical protein ACM3H8_11130 [Sphingobacteriales bacterium]
MTKATAVSLDLLQGFINEAKANSPGFNGVRIYFIRYDKTNDKLKSDTDYGVEINKKYVSEAGNSGFSQVSLAFVPINNFDPVTLSGDDFVQTGDKIHTLAICHPADWSPGTTLETGTGLCPPRGNCT